MCVYVHDEFIEEFEYEDNTDDSPKEIASHGDGSDISLENELEVVRMVNSLVLEARKAREIMASIFVRRKL